VSSMLDRVSSLFVEPAAPRAEPMLAATATAAPRALVLGRPTDAVPLASALAGGIGARFRGSAALLCSWSPINSARPGAWASAPARRLANRLAARGLLAVARGRLAWLDLDAEPEAAARTISRLLGWLDAPVITAVARPRAPIIDALLDTHDLVALVRPAERHATEEDEALERVATEGLAAARPRVAVCDPLAPGVRRWMARAGLARLGRAHPAVEPITAARTDGA
jgi:hypothetical protein